MSATETKPKGAMRQTTAANKRPKNVKGQASSAPQKGDGFHRVFVEIEDPTRKSDYQSPLQDYEERGYVLDPETKTKHRRLVCMKIPIEDHIKELKRAHVQGLEQVGLLSPIPEKPGEIDKIEQELPTTVKDAVSQMPDMSPHPESPPETDRVALSTEDLAAKT